MNEEHIDQCSAARVLGTGPVSPQMVNAQIAMTLGFFVEIQDGIVKCWDRQAGTPTERNWVPAVDFALNQSLTAEAFQKRGKPFFLLPEPGGVWVCVFELNGELVRTFEQDDEGCALALGLLHLLAEANSQD
jgi:hypothetical protein